MHDIKKQLRLYMPKALRLLFLAIAFQLLSCNQKYDNPVGPDYAGEYKLDISNDFADSSSLEILKKYMISYRYAGQDKYWKIYVSSVSSHLISDTSTRDSLKSDSGTVFFTFDKPCTTSIKLVMVRPNRTCDTAYVNTTDTNVKAFIITNPYSIDGKNTAEIGQSVSLKILRHNQDTIPDYISPIYWTNVTTKSPSMESPFKVTDTQRRIVSVCAKISIDFHLASLTLDTFKIHFLGTAPFVDSFKIIENLHLGTPAAFSFRCLDSFSDPLRYIISADKDTLLDTFIKHSSNNISVTSKPIADTIYSTISLKVIDTTDGFECSTSIAKPEIGFIKPIVKFTNYNSNVSLKDSVYLLCTGRADAYHWKKRNIKDTITQSGSITFPPYDPDTLSDTITVYGENIYRFKNPPIRIIGPIDTIILTPRFSEYTVIPTTPSLVKTKRWDSISVSVKQNDTIIPDSTLRFEWSVNGSSASLVEFKTFGPKINFFLTDTLPYFSVSVKIYDSTHLLTNWTKTIPIRVFSPTFAFQKDTIKDSVLTYNLLYSASDDTSYPGGKVDSIYLKQIGGPSGDTSTQKFTSQQETTLTFNSSGTYKIVGWAIDNESNASPKDTIILNLTTHKPEFDSTNVSKTLSLGDTAKLKAQLKSDSNIIKYYWDTNNDGKWDDSTTSKEIDTIFPKDTNYIIQAQCRNSFGDTAIARMFFHVNIKKNAPIISWFKIDTNTHYVKKPLNFLISGSDPNSSLKKVYLYMIDSFKALSVVDSSATFTPASVNDTITYQPLISGHISFFTILKDKHNNSTSSETLSIVIDSGVPEISSFTVDPATRYVKDKIVFTISGKDPDSGLKSIQLYRFTTATDSSIIDSAQFLENTHFFNTLLLIDSLRKSSADTYSYFVLLKDTNNFTRKSTTRQVVVDSGLPIIDSISIDDNTAFINKDVIIHIFVHDPDGSIAKVFRYSQDSIVLHSINGKPKKIEIVDTVRFKSGGTYRIKAKAYDNNGFGSNDLWSKDSIIVNQGIPIIKNITLRRAFAKQSTDITIHPLDNDAGLIYFISYGDINSFTAYTDSIIPKIFADSGKKVFYVKVKDSDGQFSKIDTNSIYVNLGAPTIDSVIIDSVIYINDLRKFTISAKDSNGFISKIRAYYDDTLSPNDSSVYSNGNRDTFSFTHPFATKDTGSKTIHFQVFDNDSNSSWIDKPVIVHKGSPVLQHWFSDSVNYWANDSIPFQFQCYDTNGTIKNILINWGDGFNTDTPINIKTPSYTFKTKHLYAIANDITYHLSIQLTDDDQNKSTYTDTFRVLRGMPRVWLPTGGDTLFSRIANNGGNYNVSVSGSDPNDAIVKYYWILGGNSFDTNNATYDTIATSLVLSGNQDQVNKSYRAAVLAKDMDGNIAGDTFYIYLDGPPPAPTIVYPISSSTIYSDQLVVFEWYGTDVHDSVNTRYRISILPPVSNPTEKEILKFTDNSSVTKELVNGIFHFKFQYNLTAGFGAYSWKVEAQDISNSTASSQQQPFSFVQR